MSASKKTVSQTKSVTKPSSANQGKTTSKKTPWTMEAQKRIHSSEAKEGGGRVGKDSLTAHVTKRVAATSK